MIVEPRKTLLRIALENPVLALVGVSLAAMCAVLGIEKLEAGPHAVRLLSRHHASVALIKQALCMAAIPGFALMIYGEFRSEFRDPKEPAPRLKAVVIGTLIGAVVLYGGLWWLLGSR